MTYEAFCQSLSRVVPRLTSTTAPSARIISDLGLDQLELCELHLAVQAMNEHFELPDQSDLDFVTLGDFYHHYVWMDREQHARPDTARDAVSS